MERLKEHKMSYSPFLGGSDSKKSTCNVRDLDSNPGLGRSPGGGHGNQLQCSRLKNPHGQRSLGGYSPWGRKELDMTKHTAQPLSVVQVGFPGSSAAKESACHVEDPGLIPGLGRAPGEGIGYPLQYSWTSLVTQMVTNLPVICETWA